MKTRSRNNSDQKTGGATGGITVGKDNDDGYDNREQNLFCKEGAKQLGLMNYFDINIINIFNILKGVVSYGKVPAATFLAWISLHFIASNLYVYYCAFPSIKGFIYSIFTVDMPQCIGLRWLINQCSDQIRIVWSLIGIWCMNRLLQSIAIKKD